MLHQLGVDPRNPPLGFFCRRGVEADCLSGMLYESCRHAFPFRKALVAPIFLQDGTWQYDSADTLVLDAAGKKASNGANVTTPGDFPRRFHDEAG